MLRKISPDSKVKKITFGTLSLIANTIINHWRFILLCIVYISFIYVHHTYVTFTYLCMYYLNWKWNFPMTPVCLLFGWSVGLSVIISSFTSHAPTRPIVFPFRSLSLSLTIYTNVCIYRSIFLHIFLSFYLSFYLSPSLSGAKTRLCIYII